MKPDRTQGEIDKFYPTEVPIILQALRVGDFGIAAIPAEVFVEIGLELKQKSPLQPTFTISLANGWYGYLPTVEHHQLGGYESWLGTNLLEIQAAPKIVDTLLDLLGRLSGKLGTLLWFPILDSIGGDNVIEAK